jgi:hypothetical protein
MLLEKHGLGILAGAISQGEKVKTGSFHPLTNDAG